MQRISTGNRLQCCGQERRREGGSVREGKVGEVSHN